MKSKSITYNSRWLQINMCQTTLLSTTLHLFCNVRIHSVVRLPLLFCSINIEPSSSAKVPAVLLTVNVTATYAPWSMHTFCMNSTRNNVVFGHFYKLGRLSQWNTVTCETRAQFGIPQHILSMQPASWNDWRLSTGDWCELSNLLSSNVWNCSSNIRCASVLECYIY